MVGQAVSGSGGHNADGPSPSGDKQPPPPSTTKPDDDDDDDDPPPIAEEDASKPTAATDDDAAAAAKHTKNGDEKDEKDAMDEEAGGSDAVGPSSPDGDASPPKPAENAAANEKATSETEDGDDDDGDDSPSSDDSPDDLLLRAMSHKEDGNAHFKSSDYTSAARSYRKGTNLLKKLNKANSGDEQVKQLLVSLQTNLSMVCHRQKKHRMSRDVASRALEVDAKNVKALYRRAVACRAMGDLDAAKTDLKAALKTEPNNAAVKKEWVTVKKSLVAMNAKEKAGLQKAFSKGGGSLLYSDKEEEEKCRLKKKKEKRVLDAEKKVKRKKEWEDECVRKMASDPPEEPISFDDWDKQRKKKEDSEDKARQKVKKEEEDRKREERRKKASADNPKNDKGDDSDDNDLTEKELAMLRGYKKTSDGRTTSYFNREQTEQDKKLLGSIQPKRLESKDGAASDPSSPTASASSGGAGPMGSAWNQSGTTWEERDTTDWCKRSLEQCLLDTTTAYYSTSTDDSTYVAVVKKVSDLTGDASVAIAGGKKRYIYDFHLGVEYEVLGDDQKCVASGKLKLPEVNSATTVDGDELDVDVLAWDKAPDAGWGTRLKVVTKDAIECRKLLVQDVRKSVLQFVEKFNANF